MIPNRRTRISDSKTDNVGRFSISGGKGFQIQFENGWTASVQFGPGNYCDNYAPLGRDDEKAGREGSRNAECALIDPDGNLVCREEWGGSVSNSSTPTEVLALLNEASRMPNTATTNSESKLPQHKDKDNETM